MSAILYNITVTDRFGRVLHEVTHTSITQIVQDLPRIRSVSEQRLATPKKPTKPLRTPPQGKRLGKIATI
jgi:hypothetical protein